MKLQKISIRNFQYHKSLEIKFNSDINIITGVSGTGKTGLYRAIEWLHGFSSISEKDYRMENTNETSVKGWYDSGFQVERIRSKSINRYILSKDGCEDQVFDAVGKDVPEEIQKVFEISAIDIDKEHLVLNFANQDQINFILDSYYTDGFKAKLFNKLTGNELLDKFFKLCNKESRQIKRDLRETDEQIKKQEDDLVDYTKQYNILQRKLSVVKEHYNKIQEDIEIYENLKDLADKLNTNKEGQEFVDFQKSKIKTISEDKIKELKKQAEKINQLKQIEISLKKIADDIQEVQCLKSKCVCSKVDFNKLRNDVELLQNMKQLNKQSFQNNESTSELKIKKNNIKEIIKTCQHDLKEIWDDLDVCPLCGGKK